MVTCDVTVCPARSLRRLPRVSTFTILYTLHEAGYSWQKSRTWCETGKPLRKKDGRVEESYDEYTQEKTAMIERAYVIGERLGFQVWCEDEAGPYQTIPPARPINIFEEKPRNGLPCFGLPRENCVPKPSNKVPMPFCIPGCSENSPPS